MSALVEEATRIANQFDYPASEVQKGVKEYIRQSDEGLSQEGTTLSQIPTFVTSVPNGTEKVRSPFHGQAETPLTILTGSVLGR